MAVALTPDAFLNRTTSTAWNVFFSYCGWRRIDVDRGQFTILTYLGNAGVGGGFQFTADASRRLVVFRFASFADLLGGSGPIIPVGEWWFFGLTTIGPDVANNVVLYWAKKGDVSLNSAVVSYPGQYSYTRHGVGWRPGNDGADGAFRLHGSAARDRTWSDVTLTPAEMLAEFQSPTPVKAGAWSVWPMADVATVGDDVSGNGRPLTATPAAGSITTTDDPFTDQPAEGVADLPVAVSLAAQGSAEHAGAASLPVAVALDAVGHAPHQGAAPLMVDLALSGTGARQSAGSADPPLMLSLAAEGHAPHQGTAALALDLDLATMGERSSAGIAALSLDVDVASAGARQAAGTADLGLAALLAGTGEAPDPGPPAEGTAALGTDLALVATGATRHAGTATLPLSLLLAGASALPTDPHPIEVTYRERHAVTVRDSNHVIYREPS